MLQRQRTLSALWLAACWLITTVASAQDPEALRGQLEELIAKANLGDGIGVVVADTASGERLYTKNPETPRNPASNMKLVTAATALVELGPEYRLRTTLSGALGEDGGIDSLVL